MLTLPRSPAWVIASDSGLRGTRVGGVSCDCPSALVHVICLAPVLHSVQAGFVGEGRTHRHRSSPHTDHSGRSESRIDSVGAHPEFAHTKPAMKSIMDAKWSRSVRIQEILRCYNSGFKCPLMKLLRQPRISPARTRCARSRTVGGDRSRIRSRRGWDRRR